VLTMGGNGNGLGDSLLLLPAAMVGEKSPLHSKLQSEANGWRELVTSLGCGIHEAPKPMLARFRWRRLCVLSRLRFLVLDLRIGNSTFS